MAPRRSRRWLVLAVAIEVTAGACSYYDASLLDAPAGAAGAGGVGGVAGAGGSTSPGGQGGQAPAGAAGAGQAGQAGQGGAGGPGGSGGTSGASGSSGQSGASDGAGPESKLNGCSVKPIGPPSDVQQAPDVPPFVVGLSRIDLGEELVMGEPAYKGSGFDLDGYCTCPGEASCKGSDPDPNRYCDGPDGRDNAAGQLFANLAKVETGVGSAALNEGLVKGRFNLLFQVRGYNGLLNDDRVEVTWLAAGDFSDDGTMPAGQGQDIWPTKRDNYTDGDPEKPRYVDPNAYVRDRVIVATLPGGRMSLGSLSLELVSPLLVATLHPANVAQPYWHVQNGTIAARWTTKNILAQLPSVHDPLSKKPLCMDSAIYKGVKAQICAYADISSTVQAQPNIPCDALSIALRFDAIEVKLGGLQDPSSPPACEPGTDPADDACPTP